VPHTEKRQIVKLERNENPQISSHLLHLQIPQQYQKKRKGEKTKGADFDHPLAARS
jgi:hypothetical protein